MLPVLTNMLSPARLRRHEDAVRRKPGAAPNGDLADVPHNPYGALQPHATTQADGVAEAEAPVIQPDGWLLATSRDFLNWLTLTGRQAAAGHTKAVDASKVDAAYASSTVPEPTLSALA
ncbi:hypothetical protein SAMN02745857_01686 [Andreprevotia lacus DSM 23236]|jgi:hypothetical protein|uniref:Uncharacterized protein n=1 Tax=Andreprevotia lacus DSM 23236 TaxID=1121001 RepID=A0A1W1XJS7_9NEIS|nr:hypothetical protein [Andreprevotia lacus]SMC23758.1 hypothetical protein SAMN02745857_01686 [Andreprevotia lacus DSM 23236]